MFFLNVVLRKFKNELIRKSNSCKWVQYYRSKYYRRNCIARKYVCGCGIEVGALHKPLKVPRRAKVRYVDWMSVQDLRKHYSELENEEFVEPDFIDDGEKLESIQTGSQDFVIANAFIEHCKNPIGAFRAILRVLKLGGVLFLAVPDKRYTLDAPRPVTTLAHLIKDDAEGPLEFHKQHHEEWVLAVNKAANRFQNAEEVECAVKANIANDYSIHFHVWTPTEMLEWMAFLKRMFRFEIELFHQNYDEVIFIIRKK